MVGDIEPSTRVTPKETWIIQEILLTPLITQGTRFAGTLECGILWETMSYTPRDTPTIKMKTFVQQSNSSTVCGSSPRFSLGH